MLALRTSFQILASLTLAIAFLSGDAHAQAQSSAQQNCINAMNKGGGDLATDESMVYAKCFSAAESNKLGSQTVQECVVTDPRGDVAEGIDDLVALEDENCLVQTPSFGYVGSSAAVDEAIQGVDRLTMDIFGCSVGPDFAQLTRLERKCRHVVGRGLMRLVEARAKAFRECKKNRLALGTITSGSGIGDCIEEVLTNASGRIGLTYTKMNRELVDRCSGMNLATIFPGASCSASSLSGLARCIDNRADCQSCLLLARIDGVEGSTDCDLADDGLGNSSCVAPPESEMCPIAFSMTSESRDGDGAVTRINTGHLGLNHNMDVASGQRLDFDVTCANASPPCGNCTITGLRGKQGRCRNDRTVKCDTINAADSDDCGGSTCDVTFPSTQNIFFSDLCMVPRLVSNPTGLINNETGYMQLNVDVATDVFFPDGGGNQECPTCVGDDVARDGVRAGTCHFGSRDGQACDVTGVDPTAGSMSLDCPSTPGALMSGSHPLLKHLTLETGTASLTAAVPCDSPNGSQLCPCALCAGNTDIPCSSNAQCGAYGPCNAAHPYGEPRLRNSCSNGTCTPISGTGSGECLAGPLMKGCSGLTDAEGNLLLGFCNNNADCDALNSICPGGDCGDCVSKNLPCFPDTITVTGAPDPSDPVLADVACIAGGATSGFRTNLDGGGLPGPESILLGVHLGRIYTPSTCNNP